MPGLGPIWGIHSHATCYDLALSHGEVCQKLFLHWSTMLWPYCLCKCMVLVEFKFLVFILVYGQGSHEKHCLKVLGSTTLVLLTLPVYCRCHTPDSTEIAGTFQQLILFLLHLLCVVKTVLVRQLHIFNNKQFTTNNQASSKFNTHLRCCTPFALLL